MNVPHFHVAPGVDGRWRWAWKHGNARIMADSGEGYASERNALRSIGTFLAGVHAAGPSYAYVQQAYDGEAVRYRWVLVYPADASGHVIVLDLPAAPKVA